MGGCTSLRVQAPQPGCRAGFCQVALPQVTPASGDPGVEVRLLSRPLLCRVCAWEETGE